MDRTNFCHKTRYCNTKTFHDRNKFSSQKFFYVTLNKFFFCLRGKKIPLEKMFPSQKQKSVHVSFTEKNVCHPQKKSSVTEASCGYTGSVNKGLGPPPKTMNLP